MYWRPFNIFGISSRDLESNFISDISISPNLFLRILIDFVILLLSLRRTRYAKCLDLKIHYVALISDLYSKVVVLHNPLLFGSEESYSEAFDNTDKALFHFHWRFV